jgi:uncharacterized protein (TIGR03083 family)
MKLAADERADLADLLETLTPEQWEHPSLCAGWRVRDVVAHVISYEEVGLVGLAGAFVRGGFNPKRVNDVRLAAYREREPGELVRILRAHLKPRGLTAGMGGGIGLSDCVIHHQDIRRPLQLTREIPAERLVETLEIALHAPVLPAKRNTAGLRLVPTDLDWEHGDGPEITGPGEALLLACAGRADALDDLGGDGIGTLQSRVTRDETAAARP